MTPGGAPQGDTPGTGQCSEGGGRSGAQALGTPSSWEARWVEVRPRREGKELGPGRGERPGGAHVTHLRLAATVDRDRPAGPGFSCPDRGTRDWTRVWGALLGRKVMTNLDSILLWQQRHYFANKGPSSQSYGFSSGHMDVRVGL